ncbi:PCYCGC motif-containing (lipo)protein [Paenibacillus pinihumi]|uniref:PCYCGC motif-containing (lipo)protein n=1 Tax=Paenibacillus pinihumi TaxID=669462 RepID=UPI000408E75E|nr:PCYCGC motif-containing (lipo)protein [Paenibacillus pinihumi]
MAQKPDAVKLHWLDKSLAGFVFLALLAIIVTGCASSGSEGQSGTNEHANHVSAVESEQLEKTASLAALPGFLSNHTKRTSQLYKDVAEFRDVIDELNCYCGCMTYEPAHDSLLRCFIASVDEKEVAWSDHSTSCGICKMEAEDAVAMAKEGKSTAEIKKAIDDKYKPKNI